MQYTERYKLRTYRRGADPVVEDLYDASEEEAMTQWRNASRVQDNGSRVELVRVMTVTVASSSK